MQQLIRRSMGITRSGILDNTTIIRYSHATSCGAGTESHIECLNRILLQRNSMTVYYMYMPDGAEQIQTQFIGRGKLIRIPLEYKGKARPPQSGLWEKICRKCRSVLPGSGYYIHQTREIMNFKSIIRQLFSENKVDLVVNHFVGSKGSLEIMREASARKIPVLVINHFHNKWFNRPPIRKQLKFARMAAGLSNINMPRYLRSRFVNLSSGIDTGFFNPELVAETYDPKSSRPVLLLPARIVKNKGHLDLLKIAYYLKNHGLDCKVVFAGRYDSPAFKAELDNFIHERRLADNVIFTGMLSPESLRLWYGKSTLMVLPTYHDEGLPRVILESQAMGLPPVCYNSGGVSESILQGQTGFYLKKGDLSNMRKHIAELLTNENKRRYMGKNGRRFILSSFSIQSLAQRHELNYFKLIHSAADNT